MTNTVSHWKHANQNHSEILLIHPCCRSGAKSCPTLCGPMDCSIPGFSVPHHLEFAQVDGHWIGDAIQPSHPLLPSFPSAFNLCQHRGLFQWVSCSCQMTKILEFQLQYLLPVSSQDWFPLRSTGLISLLSKGLSSVFSSTTVWKHQFFSVLPSLWSSSHSHTWLLERPLP